MGRSAQKSVNPNSIQFWYPIKNAEQLNFAGQKIIVELPQEGHILYRGRLMCGQSMEKLKAGTKAKSQKTVSARIQGASLCSVCQEKYKSAPDLEWAHWINPPALKNEPAKIQINPQLIEVVNVEQQTVVRTEPSEKSENVGENPKENQTGILLPGQC